MEHPDQAPAFTLSVRTPPCADGNESMSIEPHRCKIAVGIDSKSRLLLINSSDISYLPSNLHVYTFPKAVTVSHKLVERPDTTAVS